MSLLGLVVLLVGMRWENLAFLVPGTSLASHSALISPILRFAINSAVWWAMALAQVRSLSV